MPQSDVPPFLADPPLILPSVDRFFKLGPKQIIILQGRPPDIFACLWLAHLGVEDPPYDLDRLARLLDAAEDEVAAIIAGAHARRNLKRALLYFDAVPHETEARQRYIRIAKTSHRFCRRYGIQSGSTIVSPEHIDLVTRLLTQALPGSGWTRQRGALRLHSEWTGFERARLAMVARNPELELRERMRDISETHLATSWPEGYERVIEEWVLRGHLHPIPFDDRWNTLDRPFYERLRELQRFCDGWYHYDRAVGEVVYVPRGQWETLRETLLPLSRMPPAQERVHPTDPGGWVRGEDARWRWVKQKPTEE